MMTGKTEDTQSFYLATSFQIGPIVGFTFFSYCIFSSLESVLLKSKARTLSNSMKCLISD